MAKKIPKKKVQKSEKSQKEGIPEEKSDKKITTEEKIPKKSKREFQNEEGITQNESTGAIYVGHLPWGFTDSTLKKYFEQFGPITRIICPRSSKTGRSVGYAFIEFGDEETARIAAKTMNNYILFEKILKCSFVEDKSKYDRIFLKWKKKFEFKQKYKEHCEKLNKKKSNEEIKRLVQGLLDREERRREKLEEMGIDYKYKGFKEIVEEYKNLHKKEIIEKNKNNKNKQKEKNNKKDINNSNKDNKNINKSKKITKMEKEEDEEEENEEEDEEDDDDEKKEENEEDESEENEEMEEEENEEMDEEEEEEENEE